MPFSAARGRWTQVISFRIEYTHIQVSTIDNPAKGVTPGDWSVLPELIPARVYYSLCIVQNWQEICCKSAEREHTHQRTWKTKNQIQRKRRLSSQMNWTFSHSNYVYCFFSESQTTNVSHLALNLIFRNPTKEECYTYGALLTFRGRIHKQHFFSVLNSLFPFQRRSKRGSRKTLSVAFTICHISQDVFTLLKITLKRNSIGCVTRK